MPYPFANLTSSSTFVQWYEQTNEISTFLNEQIVANGQWAYGAFKIGANSSLNVANATFVNSSLLQVLSNTEIGNSSTGYVQFLGDLFSVAANVCLLNPITEVFVNSAITVNGTAAFTGALTVISNAAIINLATTAIRSDGNITANNGTLFARQLSFTTNGATVNSTLAAAGYQDHTFAGLEDATIWNATPSTNTVISGLDCHTAVTGSVDGARILVLQNLSTTKKITLSSANTTSTAQHRFESVDNLDIDVLPRQSVLLVYAKDTQRWRIVGGTSATGGTLSTGNTTITGWLTVAGNTTLSANLAAAPLYVNQVTARVGVGTASPSAKFHSVGPNLLEDITTMSQAIATSLSVSGNSNFANIAFFANGAAQFDNIVTVNGTGTSYIKKLQTDQLTSTGAIIGVGISGVTGTFSGAVAGASGTFGPIIGTTGTFSGALQTATHFLPAGDATQKLGDATHRWTYPFFLCQNGAADAGMTSAITTGASGEFKYVTGYTGSKYVQGVAPDGGGWLYTWKAGILVSVTAV